VNEAGLGTTLAYSVGKDLDVMAANNNTLRLAVTPADETTIPPISVKILKSAITSVQISIAAARL